LVYTRTLAYVGGVLASNGDIHFVPFRANRGQKLNSSGSPSTYSLAYTTTDAYSGGVLAPNGDIHFVPRSATVGQRISLNGVAATYSLVLTTNSAYFGGVLSSSGDVYFMPGGANATVGQKISTCAAIPFPSDVCLSSYLNKF
jgi:hypothetical protein